MRPTVSLDPIGAWIDRALSHPLAQAARAFAPDAMAQVDRARLHLPELASAVEAKVLEPVTSEARALERDVARGIGRVVDRAVRRSKKKKPS